METVIYNGRLVLEDEILENGFVRLKNGVILEVGRGDGPDALFTMNAHGGWISPGLCDIHLHGCGGHWGFFGAEDTLKMGESLATFGVTSFVPTTVSLPHDQVLNAIKEVRRAMETQNAGVGFEPLTSNTVVDSARILGIHIEGPYINRELAGAHIPLVIRKPKKEEIDDIIETGAGSIRMITLAPEISGGMELVERLAAEGIVASIGHSNATSEQTNTAIEKGASHFTHILNASRKFHQREPGCAFTALMNPAVTAEIILDNRHVHKEAAAAAIKLKTTNRMVLVSDSILAAGLGDGSYNVWGFDVLVKDGTATTPDGTMAGSVTTLNAEVRNAVELLNIDPLEAFRMATINPMKVVGFDKLAGTIEPGKAADITVLDPYFNCMATFISGIMTYDGTNSPAA